jgi:CheY-like chemotaxis protein
MYTATSTSMLRSCHVLIVDDHADGRESLRVLLELLGCRVDVAADGFEGVRKALERHPGLALIDIGLPGLDGYQVAVRLRDALDGEVLLVAHTAYDGDEARERIVRAGFDGHLVKPAYLSQLAPWLERAAARANGSPTVGDNVSRQTEPASELAFPEPRA